MYTSWFSLAGRASHLVKTSIPALLGSGKHKKNGEFRLENVMEKGLSPTKNTSPHLVIHSQHATTPHLHPQNLDLIAKMASSCYSDPKISGLTTPAHPLTAHLHSNTQGAPHPQPALRSCFSAHLGTRITPRCPLPDSIAPFAARFLIHFSHPTFSVIQYSGSHPQSRPPRTLVSPLRSNTQCSPHISNIHNYAGLVNPAISTP